MRFPKTACIACNACNAIHSQAAAAMLDSTAPLDYVRGEKIEPLDDFKNYHLEKKDNAIKSR